MKGYFEKLRGWWFFVALIILSLVFSAGPVTAQEGTATPTVEISPTVEATATPEETVSPTAEISPTVEATATPVCNDALEPNDALGTGAVLLSNQPVSFLTLGSIDDIDYFQIWVKVDYHYQINTATVDGVDTRLRLFDGQGELLAENDDYMPGDPSSRLQFQAPEDGWLFVAVDSVIPIEWGCRSYNISITDYAPATATPTPTPKPTSTPKPEPTSSPPATNTPLPELYDAYEPNYDFDSAADIGVGQVIKLNFHVFPPGDSGIDNDFFRIHVKTGQELLIETSDLAGGVDTNIIIFRSDQSVIAGNDDCEAGKLHSCLTWSVDYTGLAYILVGPVGIAPRGVSEDALDYKLRVTDLRNLPTPTSTAPEPGYGQNAPWPQTPPPTSTAEATPVPESKIRIETFSLAPPTPTPLPLQPIVIEITVYYDENDNKAPDINEGVTGVNMQVLDSLSNRLLGQTFTDEQGHATMFVSASQGVRVTVPYLGYSRQVRPPGNQFEIRISPLHLPSLIP
jgi:hypothetical protein